MQIKKIAALVALACVGLSGQAMAASMTTAQLAVVNDANTHNRIFFISGASAVQKGFTAIISKLIPGAKTYFADANGVGADGKDKSHNYEAVAGVLDSTVGGAWAGQNVIIVYRVAGGSVYGVNPVARAEAIESLNVTSACSDGGYAAADGSAASKLAFKCAKTPAGSFVVPDAGISDVSPFLFKEPFNTEGEIAQTQLNDTELAEFSNPEYNKALYALAFGVPVTKNVNVDLNKATVSAIMSGAVGTWDKVNSTLAADDIVICRRVPGSGTQAVENMYFGNFPCGASNTPAARDANEAVFNPTQAWTWTDTSTTPPTVYSGVGKYTIGANTGATVVVENSSSGDVRTCLDKAVAGGTYVTKNRDGSAALHLVEFTAGHKAVGVLSMDSLSSSKAAGNWQFRSLDGNGTYVGDNMAAPASTGTGKFPTLANLMNGTWDMQGWVSFNTPVRTQSDTVKAPIVAKLLEAAQDPTVLAGITDLKNVSAAIPGGLYSGAQVLNVAFPEGNQCAPLTRQ